MKNALSFTALTIAGLTLGDVTLAELSDCTNPPSDPPIIVNEYNAVSATDKPKDFGFDVHFGREAHNGGSWIELVVLKDGLDLRGWTLEIEQNDPAPDLEVIFPTRGWNILDDSGGNGLKKGSIITVSDNLPHDESYDPKAGDWWVNIHDPDLQTSNNELRVQIFDNMSLTNCQVSSTGEGVSPVVGIDAQEVFKLRADPSTSVAPGGSEYNDDLDTRVLSTFGRPNVWRDAFGNLHRQDFSQLRDLLTFVRVIKTNPFDGGAVTTIDVEGMAFVAPNNLLWIADDDEDAIWAINPDTGELKHRIGQEEFEADGDPPVPKEIGLGTGEGSGAGDLEAIAYDPDNDVLYVFSGDNSANTSAFRLTRNTTDELFTLGADSYVDLASVPEFTGAVFVNGQILVTNLTKISEYTWPSSNVGDDVINIAALGFGNIYGMGYDGDSLWLVATATPSGTVGTMLLRFGWGSSPLFIKAYDLGEYGIKDARAVEVIDELIYVLDGSEDYMPPELNHEIVVLSRPCCAAESRRLPGANGIRLRVLP